MGGAKVNDSEKDLEKILHDYHEAESFGQVSEAHLSDLAESLAENLFLPVREAKLILTNMVEKGA